MVIRPAREIDVKTLCAFDPVAGGDARRRQFIRDSVRRGNAFVAVAAGEIAGYVVLDRSFFGRGFVSMLIVHTDHRRRGVGSALIRHAEARCETDRLFTSTNQSNLPMQALLVKLGYSRSGAVDDLDPGDPELFYSKLVKGHAPIADATLADARQQLAMARITGNFKRGNER